MSTKICHAHFWWIFPLTGSTVWGVSWHAVLMWLLSGASKCIIMFDVQCSNDENMQTKGFGEKTTIYLLIEKTITQFIYRVSQMICEPDFDLFRRWLLVQDTFLMYVNTDTGESFCGWYPEYVIQFQLFWFDYRNSIDIALYRVSLKKGNLAIFV